MEQIQDSDQENKRRLTDNNEQPVIIKRTRASGDVVQFPFLTEEFYAERKMYRDERVRKRIQEITKERERMEETRDNGGNRAKDINHEKRKSKEDYMMFLELQSRDPE